MKPQKRKTSHATPTIRVSVIVIKDNHILLVQHRKGNKRHWVLPGGRLEYGETFQECAIRELKEETGLDIAIEKFVFLSEAIAPNCSRHIVNIYFTGHITGGTMKVGDEPVLASVELIPITQLSQLTLFPPVGKLIQEAIAHKFSLGKQYLGNMWV